MVSDRPVPESRPPVRDPNPTYDLLIRHIDLLREAIRSTRRTFIVLSNMLFIRMIGPVMERRHWVMRAEHAAQYASLLTPYRVRLTALRQYRCQ
jgi:hypothetical protein